MFLFWRCKQFRNSSLQCFKWKSKNVSTTYILPMSDSNSERNFWSQLFTLYKHCFADPYWWLSKNFLRELLTLFGQELYKQHYELVMDYQLEPTLCNVPVFFVTMTRYGFKTVSEFQPFIYRSYIVDTFLLFYSKHHVKIFWNCLHRQYKNTKFAFETESENFMSFFHITIYRDNDNDNFSLAQTNF